MAAAWTTPPCFSKFLTFQMRQTKRFLAINMSFSCFTTTNAILMRHSLSYNRLGSALHKFQLSQPSFPKSATFHEQSKVRLPSYLCIPPSQSENHVSILIPHFNFDFSTVGRNLMKDNLERRNLLASLDIDRIASDWSRRKELKDEVAKVEESLSKIRRELREKSGKEVPKESLANQLEDLALIKKELQLIKKSLRDLEETLMQKVVLLPNDIHEATPIVGQSSSDAEVPAKSSSIELEPYYRDEFALAELAAMDFFADRFSKSHFVPFSGPDVCKPIVVEGCGYDFNDPEATFHLKGDSEQGPTQYHLTGSASLPSFCACHAKCSLNRSLLPVKYFSVGRTYIPPKSGRSDPIQSTRLHFFTGTPSVSEEDRMFLSCLEILRAAYDDLGLSVLPVEVLANQLSLAECRRTDLKLRSPSTQTYRTLASVASCGDFISKRLWLCYHDGTKNGFLRVVHGTGIDFPQLIAHLVESRKTEDGAVEFPPSLRAYMKNY